MSEEILINITPMESRVAVVENGVLQEVHVERTQRRGIVGNIYKGRVQRVLPGMQSAFVEIGLERDAFLYVSDLFDEEEDLDDLVDVSETKEIPAVKSARAQTEMLGHDVISDQLLHMFSTGRMPHGLVFAGPSGVGKSTMTTLLASS